jgi:signal transduction histidine kinase
LIWHINLLNFISTFRQRSKISVLNFKQVIFPAIRKIGVKPEDDDETKLRKSLLVTTTILISIAAVVWGLIYLSFDEIFPSTIPFSYSLFSSISLIILVFKKKFRLFRFTQLLLILLLPFMLMISLGGFISGSAVILWGVLSPIGALLCGSSKQARYWFIVYILSIIVSGIIQPQIDHSNNLPRYIITIFFVINIGAVSTIAFVTLSYFVKQKDLLIELMKKNRELEQAYLQQEVTLRQSEKLATLGKLSAGIAHELNNPASAAVRGAEHLKNNISELQKTQFKLGKLSLSDEQLEKVKSLNELFYEKSKQPNELDPLTRSNLENEMEEWLEEKGISNCWELASTIVNTGFTKEELADLTKIFTNEQFPVVVSSLGTNFITDSLTEEIKQGAERITQIVKALRSYTYLDQAPIQSVDIHEGLDNTLVMLRSRLKNGISVEREYSENLPRIQAYGSELNQVWTNIIDNAIDAMSGNGRITIKTYKENQHLVVELKDSGPGIPEDIQSKIFDPFFTTKSVGKGTGLGLNISHNIIVQKHKGEIKVKSRPGETYFQIKLPIT